MSAKKELAELRSFIADAVPYLEEAWEACFDGKEKALLSAEERGMGRLLQRFRDIATGKPPVPFGMITLKQAQKQEQEALAWAYRLLGNPNELKPELREYMRLGETLATGLERAHAEILRLRAKLGHHL